jgi:hypothetical protein
MPENTDTTKTAEPPSSESPSTLCSLGLFRKKPVVIEAFQLTEEAALAYFVDRSPLPFGLSLSGNYHPGDRKLWSAWATIETLEGNMKATIGDWIIKGIKGELYPCKPEIFQATYEAVSNSPENAGHLARKPAPQDSDT